MRPHGHAGNHRSTFWGKRKPPRQAMCSGGCRRSASSVISTGAVARAQHGEISHAEMMVGDFSTSLRSARNDMGIRFAPLEMTRGPHCSARNDMGGPHRCARNDEGRGYASPFDAEISRLRRFAPSLEMTISAYAAAFWAILHSSAKPCGSLTAMSASTLRSSSMPAVLRPCMKTE